MIVNKQQSVPTDKTHRKQGGAFDTLSNVLRNVTELVFRNDLIMRNRPSKITNSKNVFEMYVTQNANKAFNYFFFGRSGVASDTQNKNVNYIELSADADTSKPEANSANGQVRMNLTTDKQGTNAYIGVAHALASDSRSSGIYANVLAEGDGSSSDVGAAQLAYLNTSTGAYTIISVSKNGIQFFNLPTNATGLASGTLWSSSGELRIVP